MNIGKFSLNNRYVVLSIIFGIVIFGIFALTDMQKQLAPDTTPPIVSVMVSYPGAAAQDVVNDIVEPMENELGRIEGVADISSTSQDNLATVEVQFGYEEDVDEASIEVQNSINRIREDLPEDMEEPVIFEFGTAEMPIMTISISSDSLSMQDLRQLVENRISQEFRLVEGVAAVDLYGGYNQEVQVNVDKNKLNAHGLSLEQLSGLLAEQNIKAPGGQIRYEDKDINVRVDDSFRSIEDLKMLPVTLEDGNYLYLKDVADVNLALEDQESYYRFNGETSIALLVSKTSDANTIEVVENVKDRLGELENQHPHLDFEIAQDDSVFTKQMVDNMTESIILAIVFTVVVVVLFIARANQSLVIAISMPLIFLCTLVLMYLFDMSFDMVTMSALILSIGWVIDATVVVVENIMTHHKEYGKDIYTAAVEGTREVSVPLLAGGSTTIIVLLPLLFVVGFVGEMFRPLSMTIIFAILSSVIVGVIVVPLLTYYFNRFQFKRLDYYLGYVTAPFNNAMSKLMGVYINTLKTSMNNKLKVFVVLAALLIISSRVMAGIGVEMLPKFDSGVVYVSAELDAGTTLEETTETVKEIEAILKEEPNVESFDAQIGYEPGSLQTGDFGVMDTNQAFITANLNTRLERKESIWDFQERLRHEIEKIPALSRFVVREEGGTPATGTSLAPLDVKISGSDRELLFQIADDLMEEINRVEGTAKLYKSFTMDDQQITIRTDRVRTQELGLHSTDISRQVFGALEGIETSTIDFGEVTDLDISVKYREQFRSDIDDLQDIYINTPQNIQVPLREVAEIEQQERANLITTENNEFTINILGYTHDRAFSHVAGDINEILNEYSLPTGYNAVLTGEMEDIQDSFEDMVFLMLLALLLVYLILVSQFKSFIHPVSMMSVIPFAVIGIAPALLLTGKFISMPVLLGFILVAGTIINNSILLVDNINAKKADGNDTLTAVTGATRDRFRPIMMTALSDVAGMTPLALQLALGSERFSPLAIAVIGGVLVATFLTMIVVPVIYGAFENIKHFLGRWLPSE